MQGNRLQSAKWHQWKVNLFEQEGFYSTWTPYNLPHLHNLEWDLREEHEVDFPHAWVLHPVAAAAAAFLKTLAVEPPIKPGTPDPYQPPKPGELRPEEHIQLGVMTQRAIEPDLSARVFSGAADPVELPAAPASSHTADRNTALSMLLVRFKGEHTVRGIEEKLMGSSEGADKTVQAELLFEVDKRGNASVRSPAQGVAAMAKSDVVSWGGFGVVYGAIVGAVSNGGILSFIEGGVATGIAWAIFGLVAGALYGLWAGRAVSARRLKGIGPLLPPDSSMMLAWADGDITQQMVAEFSTTEGQALILRFNPAGRGALLEV
jgi:hypothetical protein